jgi:hypothetical protein
MSIQKLWGLAEILQGCLIARRNSNSEPMWWMVGFPPKACFPLDITNARQNQRSNM